ncbi:MAG TPA: AlpA family phage regulatory protein [Gallionellaceae bacterium]|nr:AlpA family phage regulatory protein [Gallionellaceae bacterium]
MRLLKLPQVLDLTATSRTTHYSNIKTGLMTAPVPLGVHSVAWPEHEISQLIAARIAGKSDEEIRQIVRDMMSKRGSLL